MKKHIIYMLLIFSCNNSREMKMNQKLIIIAKKEFKKELNINTDDFEPYIVKRENYVWKIKGSLKNNREGGVPVILLDTTTLKVKEIYHTK